jgi:hypothetical protein
MINDTHVAQGIESFQVELDEDETETQAAADGMAILIENPIRTGIIQLTVLDSSPTTDIMWDAFESDSGIKISFSDANAPKLAVLGENGRVVKRPIVRREKGVQLVEWNVKFAYIAARGGSYALQAPA